MPQTIYTIGFTKKNLRTFMQLLQAAQVEQLIDIRLHNTSQLAGYAKKDDLQFLCEIFGIAYAHVPELAPTKEILACFKQDKDWAAYEASFLELLEQRKAVELWQKRFLDYTRVCLLCSEHEPAHCHRRLAAEYLERNLPDITVQHLT